MDIDWILVATTFGIGIVVGLTGMGGGALMTPALVIFFGVPPLTAVSSDLVASAVMKPVGSLVHLRRGTVNLHLVKWLAIGSVPAAFSGVLIARAMGTGEKVQQGIQIALGVALLIAAAGLAIRAYLRLAERARRRAGDAAPLPQDRPEVTVRILPTLLVGIVGGVVVGITSVGSGSLIIIALMALYPALKASQLVGTDLVQAVPLVAAAALGHVLFGDFQLALTASLLIGCVPGAWIGARISVARPGRFRPPRAGLRAAGLGPEDARCPDAGDRCHPRRGAPHGTAGLVRAPAPLRLPGAGAPAALPAAARQQGRGGELHHLVLTVAPPREGRRLSPPWDRRARRSARRSGCRPRPSWG